MKKQIRSLGIVVAAALLLGGCGDNKDETIIIVAETPTPALTPTQVLTPTPAGSTPTAVLPTETPGSGATSTPVAGATATATVAGPTTGATETPGAAATATRTPTPAPTATAAGPFCGDGVKEGTEQCDSGATFGITGDCATECACCICRSNITEHALGLTCSTCHPGVAPIPEFPPGAAETFPALCQ